MIHATLTLFRGLPGSGKSTLAKAMKEAMPDDYVDIHEADDYFTSVHGDYNFDPALIPHAHQTCLDNAIDTLRRGRMAIVANTFTQLWELAPYIKYAEKNGIKWVVFECTFPGQSIHGVPEDAIDAMSDRWETMPDPEDNRSPSNRAAEVAFWAKQETRRP